MKTGSTQSSFYSFLIFVLLVGLSQNTKADVLWRTANIGFSQSFMETQMLNNLSSSIVTGSSTAIDIDQNGTEDFQLRWEIFGTPGNQPCSEGTISYNDKVGHWILKRGSDNPFTDFYFPAYYSYSILEPSSKGSAGTMNRGEDLIAHLGKKFFMPYPSATCNGLSSQSSLGGLLNGGGGILAGRFMRNGNMHLCWMKFEGGFITEIAWESIALFPIKLGSKTSVLHQIAPPYVVISGQVFIDANANCIKETTEGSLTNAEVLIKNTNYKAIVGPSGYYAIYLPYQNGAVYELEVRARNTYGAVASCNQLTLPEISSAGQAIQQNIAITPSACPNIAVKVDALPLRRCFRSLFTVSYENTGSVAATNRQIKVALPQWVKAISSAPAWTSNINDTLTFDLSTINALSKGTITIVDSVSCDIEMIRGMDQCIKAFVNPSTTCVAGMVWNGPDVNVKGICQSGILNLTVSNEGGDMTDSSSYRIALNKVLVRDKKYKLASGESVQVAIPAHGSAVHVEVDQVDLHPVLKSRVFAMEGCGDFEEDEIAKGIIHTLPYVKEGNTESTVCTTILDSYDPNDKTAMPGEGLINANQDIYYTIRFQNTGTASAIHVVVNDTLSSNLDVSSFQIISSSHPQIMASYLFQSGGKNVVKFTFHNINLAKKSTSETLSQGYVTFKISQRADLNIGEQIKNKAFIYFDYNSPIITNETVHEIGAPLTDGVLKVIQTLSDQSICEGQPVNLSVVSEHEQKYEWYKDNVLLTNEEYNQLIINQLSGNTVGVYTCKIIGLLDTVTTSTDVALKSVEECQTTSVSDPTYQAFSLFPNPAKSEFYIETIYDGSYTIYDVYGSLIDQGSLRQGVNYIRSTHALKQGHYLISIKTNESTKTVPLLVQ